MVVGFPCGGRRSTIHENSLLMSWGTGRAGFLTTMKKLARPWWVGRKIRGQPAEDGQWSLNGLIDCTNAVEKWRKVATASTISRGIVTLQSCSQKKVIEVNHWRGLRKRMKLSRIGRVSMAFVVSVAMGLGMTACGGGTIGFMWGLGTQYNQIAAFKIDDFTGNLTTVLGSPFTSGGANPASLVVSTGGRYVYVVNEGLPQGATLPSGSTSLPCGTGGGIAEFSVGGQGVLTFQQ